MFAKLVARLSANSLCRSNNNKSPAVSHQRSNEQQIQTKRYLNRSLEKLPKREEQLETLGKCEYDVLVIGGGATGAGCALDAVTRGLKTALVEADDFASGTTSKSPKLVLGVQELNMALRRFNLKQFRQVRGTLRERAIMANIAPHLEQPLPMLVPIYSLSHIPYSWLALKFYDLVAGYSGYRQSRFITKWRTMDAFPLLEHEHLCGSFVFYGSQYDDARFCLSLALTAAEQGATIANYVEAINLEHDDTFSNRSVEVLDRLTSKKFGVSTRCVINATGPFIDAVRKMDYKQVEPVTQPSSGTHVVLPGYFCSKQYGLLDPFIEDERVIFMMPWRGHTIVGATEVPCELSQHPRPTKVEVEYILNNLRSSFNCKVDVGLNHVRSAWTGIRQQLLPELAQQRDAIADHIVEVSPNQLITIAGGRVSTYRAMAQDTVDLAINYCDLTARFGCQTEITPLTGSENWSSHLAIELVQLYDLPMDVARHLSECYGTNAFLLVSTFDNQLERLHTGFPFIEAEIHYACAYEFAHTLVDVIARRLRIAFLDVTATVELMPRIANIMAMKLHWSDDEKSAQLSKATQFLAMEMGMSMVAQEHSVLQLDSVATK